jgi:hypothetical protein
MRSEYNQKFNPDLVEMNEKLRRDVMRSIESYGARQLSELPEMSEAERAKWFFWNMHENLNDFRKLEPTLIGQVMCTQLNVTEGESMDAEKPGGLEKRLTLHCKWHLRLSYSAIQNEEAYSIGEGSVDLLISNTPPANPSLQKNQKGYLDSDNSLYPNQLYMCGWVSDAIWDEMKQHLYSPSPNCHTDILLRDSYLYPVKTGFDFVVGPPGAVGFTNMDFRAAAYSGERRTTRRGETLQR